MSNEQIQQLVTDYYECEFGLTELIKRAESVVLENVREYIRHHNLKAGDYLLHVADKDVLITASYTRKMCDELKRE
jgi:hypothetical protein